MKKRNFGGFTLVELLIVVALIAVLSVAVLAAVNPVEQTNKARDAAFKNDASEVLSAYERYYASQSQYPWSSTSFGTNAIPVENKMVLDSRDLRFGIVDPSSNTVNGLLISTSELKSSFGSKAPFKSTATNTDKIYVYSNGSGVNYTCFCPKANINRTGTNGDNLKCISLNNGSLGIDAEVKNIGAGCAKPSAFPSTFCDPGGTIANMMCVPEGTVQ